MMSSDKRNTARIMGMVGGGGGGSRSDSATCTDTAKCRERATASRNHGMHNAESCCIAKRSKAGACWHGSKGCFLFFFSSLLLSFSHYSPEAFASFFHCSFTSSSSSIISSRRSERQAIGWEGKKQESEGVQNGSGSFAFWFFLASERVLRHDGRGGIII